MKAASAPHLALPRRHRMIRAIIRGRIAQGTHATRAAPTTAKRARAPERRFSGASIVPRASSRRRGVRGATRLSHAEAARGTST